MAFRIPAALSVAAALVVSVGSAGAADQCGRAPTPTSPIAKCLKANGAKWMFGPYHKRCEWFTPDREIWVKCGVVPR